MIRKYYELFSDEYCCLLCIENLRMCAVQGAEMARWRSIDKQSLNNARYQAYVLALATIYAFIHLFIGHMRENLFSGLLLAFFRGDYCPFCSRFRFNILHSHCHLSYRCNAQTYGASYSMAPLIKTQLPHSIFYLSEVCFSSGERRLTRVKRQLCVCNGACV